MKATVAQTNGFTHRIDIRHHEVTVDEPSDVGGNDEGPNPQELLAASLAACTAITVEMYAERKGWDMARVAVDCEYEQADRGAPTQFTVTLRLPGGLSDEQVDRLSAIAAKCPVHRTLEGDVSFDQRIATERP
jgi:putative redox protein